MKNLNLTQLFVLVLSLSVFFTACRPDALSDLDLNHDDQATANFDINTTEAKIASNIAVQNGILVFENFDDYKSTLLALSKMPQQERRAWEQKTGFVSMRGIFEDIMAAEWEQSKNGTTTGHSVLYQSNLSNGIIAERLLSDGTKLYDLNIFNPFYALIINKNGFVKIGEDLFQFTAGALKQMQNTGLEQVQLLMNAQNSDSRLGIEVINMNSTIQDRTTRFWNDKTADTRDQTMLILSGNFSSRFGSSVSSVPGSNIIFVDYAINAKSMRKDARGNWYYDPTQIELYGESATSVQLSNGSSVMTQQHIKTYTEQVFSADFFFMPDEAGSWTAPRGFYFPNLWQLENCLWRARTRDNNCMIQHVR